MPRPYNAELLKILQDMEPTDDEALNQANYDVLENLHSAADDGNFRDRVRVKSGELKLAIESELMVETSPETLPEFGADFINDTEISVGSADSIMELRALVTQKQARFTALMVEQAKIAALTDSPADRKTADDIAAFALNKADLAPFFAKFAIPTPSVLNASDCELIKKSAAKKSQELKLKALRLTKITNATADGTNVATSLAEAVKKMKEATAFAKTAKAEVSKQESVVAGAETELENNKVSFFSLNQKQETERYEQKQKELAFANRTLTEVKVAQLAAEANATFAIEQEKLARDSAAEALKKLNEAQAEMDPKKSIELSEEAQDLYLKVSKAVEAVKEARTTAENEQKLALDPTNADLKRRRANLLIERNGSIGFTDEIVRAGDKTSKAVKPAAAAGVTLSTGKAEFDPIRLGSGDTIHSTQLGEGGGEIRLVQDWRGMVSDQSDYNGGKLTDRDKSLAAIKQAKMVLLNYKPEQGPIFIRGGGPEQASRVYAALLLLSQNNPELNLSPTAIISCVDGCAAQGTFQLQSTFIKTQLSGLNSREGEAEGKDLSQQRKDFKEKYQGVIEVPDLTETPESVRKGIKP